MAKPQVIFEDEFLIVINKPAGVVVNRADTTGKIETIQDWAEGKLTVGNPQLSVTDEIHQEFANRSGIVHRLDKDTSGVLVIAKDPKTFEKLKNQFKNREVIKRYLALVHGKVEPSEGVVDAPIERNPFNRMHFGVFPGGRSALTKFRVLMFLRLPESLQLEDRTFSLLEVEPKTGRTHQIRVHMKYAGHSVVSDPIYAGRKNVKEDLRWCSRLFLHAGYLKIMHPDSGQPIEFKAPLPSELAQVLEKLDRIDSM